MSALAVALLAAAIMASVPVLVFVVEVLLALLPSRTGIFKGERRPLAVLVPAHDEEVVIGASLATLVTQLANGDRLVVIADNCTDGTAAIARAAGAEVVERTDPVRRGKGYALDFGIRHLASAPPEIVVVVDADCVLAPGAIDRLARQAIRDARPVQALYLMRAPHGASVKSRIAEFAWVIKNHVRPLGLARIGMPCQLMGTGMAFPWPSLRTADVASGAIVEDMKLGLDLARAGQAPVFCPEALVWSEFPVDEGALKAQRTRWEHGHLGMIGEVPGLIWQALRRLDVGLLAMALDLSVPPLALLATIVGGLAFVSALVAYGGGSTLPLWVALGEVAALVVSVLLAWSRWGRGAVPLQGLAMLPLYALWKLPIYVYFWFRRQTAWVRTRRG